MHAGNRLRLFRLLAGWKQADIAAAIGKAQSHITAVEICRFNPNQEILQQYCKHIGLNPAYIGNGSPPLFPVSVGIFQFPAKSLLYSKGFGRSYNELKKIIPNIFPEVLSELKVNNYFLIRSKNGQHMVYIIPIKQEVPVDKQLPVYNYMIICSSNNYNIIRQCIDSQLEKSEEITAAVDFSFNSDELEILQIAKSYLNSKGSDYHIPEHIVEQWKNTKNIFKYSKTLLQDNFMGLVNYTELYKVFNNGQEFDVKMLKPKIQLDENILQTFNENPIYAIAIRDENNIFYLFRRTDPNHYFIGDKPLQADIDARITNTEKKIAYSVEEIDTMLWEKIKSWTFVKEDIEPIFNKVAKIDGEEDLIAFIRQNNMPVHKAIDCLKANMR